MLTAAKFWGDDKIRSGKPALRVVENAIYLPQKIDIPINDDNTWGLYDQYGHRIEEAHYAIGDKNLSGFQSINPEEFDDLPCLDAPIIYAGFANLHFGHFVCGSLGRLWALTDYDQHQILFHCPYSPRIIFNHNFARTCLEAFSKSCADVIAPEHPIRISKIIVPKPNFEEQKGVYPGYRSMCLSIGERFWRKPSSSAPIYLSKSRLPLGVSRISNESLIEKTLLSKGVEIVFPEMLSFGDQIALFSENRPMLGSVGSAFHTHGFALGDNRIIGLQASGAVNSNFKLIDNGTNRRASYYNPTGEVKNNEPFPNFIENLELSNPSGVALALLDAI